MTSHELARRLLELPEKPCVMFDGCCSTYDVEVARLTNPGDWVKLHGRPTDQQDVVILE